MTLDFVPLTQREAAAFIRQHHRHHKPARGDVFRLAVVSDSEICGVATVGRPTGRRFQDGLTLEVNRTCTLPAAPMGANSALYARAWKVARLIGWQRLITYTQDRCEACTRRAAEHAPGDGCTGYRGETGASLRGAGWVVLAQRAPNRGWDRPSRPRVLQGNEQIQRTLWGAA